MRSWRSGNYCVTIDRGGVTIWNNVGGSTLTSEGSGCSLEEFLGGQLHDAIPAGFLSEMLEVAAELAGRKLEDVLGALERGPEKLEPGSENAQEAERAEREWAQLVRNTAESGPPGLWNEELVRSVAMLANEPEHSAWAQPFLERMLQASDNPSILVACIEGLTQTGSSIGEGWICIGDAQRPRFAKIGDSASLPNWVWGLPSCGQCGSAQTSLLFCREGFRSDQSYDYHNALAEAQCTSCGAFSVHICDAESRC
jgi:hypothetical protein